MEIRIVGFVIYNITIIKIRPWVSFIYSYQASLVKRFYYLHESPMDLIILDVIVFRCSQNFN